MPTHEEFIQFIREFSKLSEANQDRFTAAMKQMVRDLRAGSPFRSSLRVKAVQGHPGVFEMTWSPDGRATFHFGPPKRPGEAHIVW